MAKDPAFLFYPGDYIAGTMYLDFECKGAYMDLLMLQFQKDHMSIHMIKQVLGHMFEHIWPLISDKFKESDGKYWNERLRIEKEKRLKFCKSRKDNRKNKKDMSVHMLPHMENENENTINNKNNGVENNQCYDIEKYLQKHQKHFEAICMAYPRYSQEEVLHTIAAYHLECVSKDMYPRKPVQLIAGIKKWLLNKPKNSNNGRSNAASVGKTFKPD